MSSDAQPSSSMRSPVSPPASFPLVGVAVPPAVRVQRLDAGGGAEPLEEDLDAVRAERVQAAFGEPEFRWLYHPYDGGVDVILPTPAERDTLKERHQTWLSTHPSGL